MGISSLSWAIKKRKISFFSQILENEITSQLAMTRESSMEFVYKILRIESGRDDNTKVSAIRRCREELNRVKTIEANGKRNLSNLAKIIVRLLGERQMGKNEETLQLIIASKNGMRDLMRDEDETSFNRSMDAG